MLTIMCLIKFFIFQRLASVGSFGSFDKSLQPKSANSGASSDAVFYPQHASISKQPNKFTIASSETSNPQHASMIDPFSLEISQQQSKETPVDLFADFNDHPSCSSPSENKPSPAVPSSENGGWALFDTLHQAASNPEASKGLPSTTPPCIEDSTAIFGALSSNQGTSQLFAAKKFTVHGEETSTTNQWHTGFSETQNAANFGSSMVSNLLVVRRKFCHSLKLSNAF